jgi:hypothetical protein
LTFYYLQKLLSSFPSMGQGLTLTINLGERLEETLQEKPCVADVKTGVRGGLWQG